MHYPKHIASCIFPFPERINNEWRRGKLITKKIYSEAHKLISEDFIDYDMKALHAIPGYRVIKIPNYGGYIYARDYTIGGIAKVIKQENKRYNNDNIAFKKVREYKYNSSLHKQATESKEYIDQNDAISTTYYYPSEYGDYFTSLIRQNILTPIDVRSYRNGKLISGTQIKYNDYGLPETNYSFENSLKNFVFNKDQPFTFTPYLWRTYSRDNLLQSEKGRDENNIIYLWSYTNQYPIAKIENANFEKVERAVKEIFNVADINELFKMKNPGKEKIKLLHTNSHLKEALITTYIYQPLIGILTTTDPRGITTYYNYDDFGRLESIKNNNGKYLEKYEYNLTSYSQNLSIITSPECHQFRQTHFDVQVKEGSGRYSYKWVVKDNMGNTFMNSNNRTFSMTFTKLGEMRVECQVTDKENNDTFKTVKTITVIPPPSLYTSEITSNPEELRVNGKKVNFYVSAFEGSRNYTWNWTIKTPSKTITSTNTVFSTIFEEHGNLKVTCTVYDTGTNESVTKEFNSYIQYPLPLQLKEITSTAPPGLTRYVGYGITIADGSGSGNFSYAWKVKTPTRTITDFADKPTMGYNFTEEGMTYISCTVKDKYTGETQTMELPQFVKQSIYFSNISQSEEPAFDNFIATAEINCPKEVSITVELGVERESHLSNGPVEIKIGPRSYTIWSGKSNEKLTLPKGKNKVEIRLHKDRNINHLHTAWIKILEVSSEFAIGGASTLTRRAL